MKEYLFKAKQSIKDGERERERKFHIRKSGGGVAGGRGGRGEGGGVGVTTREGERKRRRKREECGYRRKTWNFRLDTDTHTHTRPPPCDFLFWPRLASPCLIVSQLVSNRLGRHRAKIAADFFATHLSSAFNRFYNTRSMTNPLTLDFFRFFLSRVRKKKNLSKQGQRRKLHHKGGVIKTQSQSETPPPRGEQSPSGLSATPSHLVGKKRNITKRDPRLINRSNQRLSLLFFFFSFFFCLTKN